MKRVTRRELLKGLGLTAAASWAGCRTMPARRKSGARETRPNFLVIFADDLGYGDLGCYGATAIKTPHLDRMAAEGLRFSSFYVCAAVCTPSRAGLLTGRYPIRTGLTRVLSPLSKDGIEDSEITLAEALKAEGYATACIGKWHLGHLRQYLPTRHGFDYYYGIPYSNDMDKQDRGHPPIPLMRGEEVIEQPAQQETLTQRYTDEAIGFIREHRDRPFFVYLPHSMPHVPLHASPQFAGKSARGLYGDVIEEMDWNMGRIIQALRDLHLDQNTLVLFTSDNGPWLSQGPNGGSAGSLRMGKGTTFEGGVRVPCIAWWPSQIRPGRVEDAPAITLDLLPTFVEMAGGKLPSDRVLDGQNIEALLRGTGRQENRNFFFYLGEELQAHRSGPWKLKRPFKGQVYGKPLEHPTLLFNLKDDPGEQHDVAASHPALVRHLEQQMSAFEDNLGPIPITKR